ncbi:MAG: MFS transporter [Gammaproteobacteria bacterium]
MNNTTWKRQFNILWVGQVFMLAILGMSLPYWPLYIEELGNFTPGEIRIWSAALCVAPFITAILCAPIWGKIGDKFGYKPMVLRACVGIFLTQTLILLFTDVWFILFFRVLQGILGGFIVSAQAFALAMTNDQERGTTLGKLQSATAIAAILGPMLGGVIAGFAGYQAIFIAASVISGIVTVIFFIFLKDVPKAAKKPALTGAKPVSIFQKKILVILLVISMIQLAEQMITPVFALFVSDQLGADGILVGFLYAAPGFMIFALAPYWGKLVDKMTQRGYSIYYFIAALLFSSAALQVLHAYAETVTAVFALRALWGICLGALLPLLLRILVDNVDPSERGAFLGFGNSASKFGTVLGILCGATTEAYFGYSNSFIIMGIMYFIAGIIMLAANPNKKMFRPYNGNNLRKFSVDSFSTVSNGTPR